MESTGKGAALNASVSTDLSYAEALSRVSQDEDARIVAACQAKVEKLKAHLAGAEQALAEALAVQKGRK